MATNTIWLIVPTIAVPTLALLGAAESQIPSKAWWTCVAIIISVLVLWKYFVRRYLNQDWNPTFSFTEMRSARTLAYAWMGMYFVAGSGFIATLVASQYFHFSLHTGLLITFFSAWFIKLEIWALLLDGTRDALIRGSSIKTS